MGNPLSTAWKPENVERVLESKYCYSLDTHDINAKSAELIYF
jgi:hypothetical protein